MRYAVWVGGDGVGEPGWVVAGVEVVADWTEAPAPGDFRPLSPNRVHRGEWDERAARLVAGFARAVHGERGDVRAVVCSVRGRA